MMALPGPRSALTRQTRDAVANIWTAIGIQLIAFASARPAPWKLLVATAPAVFAATAARARMISRRAI